MISLRNRKLIPTVGIILVVAAVGYFLWTAPDRRDPGEKLGDAIGELHNGVDKAARQLEDRTPGEKLGDVASDAKDDAKKALNQE